MELIIEPDDGIEPLLNLIKSARESLNVAVFRFDRRDLEKALKSAIGNGVKVSAFIADANRGGEKNLRKLEMRFLEAGITVSRSGHDLLRHHNKLMIVDRRILAVLSFNFTHLDIDHSRGFGLLTEHPKWVAEAFGLLEADSMRAPYTPGSDTFVVSPENARKVLGDFLKEARKQLLIYDPKISDREMVRILKERGKAGVEIRVIGQAKGSFAVRKLSKLRLHTRTIIRDGERAFIGSQSLRANELDARREVGLIIHDSAIIKKLADTFEVDWESGIPQKGSAEARPRKKSKKDSDEALEVLVSQLNPIANKVKEVVQEVVAQAGEEVLEDGSVKKTVTKVVKNAVKQAVKEAISNGK